MPHSDLILISRIGRHKTQNTKKIFKSHFTFRSIRFLLDKYRSEHVFPPILNDNVVQPMLMSMLMLSAVVMVFSKIA